MDNYKELRKKRNKRRKQERVILLGMIGVAVVITIVFWCLLLNNKEAKTKELAGLWIYDSVTSYEFTSDNKGVMHVSEQNFHFSYRLDNVRLRIDFENDSVQDCVYKFSIDGNILTIEGKRGTTGGIYKLVKKEL